MPNFSFGRFAAPAPSSYHLSLAHLLERRYPEQWARFDDPSAKAAAAADVGLELARRAEPIDLRADPELYRAAGEISGAMGLEAPITLYRAVGPAKRNAALYFEPDHAHLVFEGDLLSTFEAAEIWYVIGHELAHHRLWTAQEARLWTAHRLIGAMAATRGAAAVFRETERLETLYTEIFADRYGLWACGDLDAALNAHVKIAAGQDDVGGAAYLAQAEQALAERGDAAEAPAPEGLARAALLAAWSRDAGAAEARARSVIEGDAGLERLDLLGQERIADVTHWMLYEFLGDPWRRRGLVRAHAAQISPTLAEALDRPRAEAEETDIDGLRAAIVALPASVRRYLAYLLLDFVTVDPEIEDMALAAALQFAEDFSLGPVFKSVAAQELKVTKTKLGELEKNAGDLMLRAELLFGDAPPRAPQLGLDAEADPPAAVPPDDAAGAEAGVPEAGGGGSKGPDKGPDRRLAG